MQNDVIIHKIEWLKRVYRFKFDVGATRVRVPRGFAALMTAQRREVTDADRTEDLPFTVCGLEVVEDDIDYDHIEVF